MIKIENVTKVYLLGEIEVHALRGVSFEVKDQEFVAIMGASGSGKTTMMDIMGCLARPTSGRYLFQSKDVNMLSDDTLADIRNKSIGFVFQTFNLIPRLSVLANTELPLVYGGVEKAERKERAVKVLEQLGMGDRLYHMPNEISGGQQQRVAIARALINHPLVILADEPTGNLDSQSSHELMRIFCQLHDEGNTTVMVTHEKDMAKYSQRIIKFRDGKIQE